MPHKIIKYVTIKGVLNCDTGLRIGGSKESIEIGGLENTIIRHPLTEEPYIPGSSLKGKVRSLLEYKLGRRDQYNQPKTGKDDKGKDKDDGEPCECGRCDICRVFGPHKKTKHDLGPTRVLFRDAKLTTKSHMKLKEAQEAKGIFFAELKTENMIKRNVGAAENPRTQERVPEGTQFDFEISIRIFDSDDEKKTIALIEDGLALLQKDYLGASGSRGYGKVSLNYQVI